MQITTLTEAEDVRAMLQYLELPYTERRSWLLFRVFTVQVAPEQALWTRRRIWQGVAKLQ